MTNKDNSKGQHTNYWLSWDKFCRSEEYKELCEALKEVGVEQPYSSNIIQRAFAAGFAASGTEIKFL